MRCLGRLLVVGLLVVGLIAVIAIGLNGSNSDDSDQPTARSGGSTRAVRAAAYDVIKDDDSSIGGRDRYNIAIVTDPSASDAALQGAMADAVRGGFDRHQDAEVINVFAYSTEALVDNGADVGRAFASTDGGGLGGDNDGLLGPDQEGVIQIEIHSMSSDVTQSETDL